MKKSKSAPLPWEHAVGGGRRTKMSYVIGADGNLVCGSMILGNADGRRIEDHARIVKCVNCHDDLVTAVRKLLRRVGRFGNSPSDYDASSYATAVLHRAEKGARK